jgi:CSLREA domain-containing protein
MKSRLVCAFSVIVLLAGARAGVAAPAASIAVTTTIDELNSDGDCSLREAVQAANADAAVDACASGSGADTITLPAGTYVLNQPGGDLKLTSNITLRGAGAGLTILDADGDDRSVLQTRNTSLLLCSGTDNAIRRYTVNGAPDGVLVAAGAGGLSIPNTALVYDNALYVAGFGSGVKRYALPSGAFGATVVAPTGAYGLYNGLRASDMLVRFSGATPELLIADYLGPAASDPGRIVRFNADTGAFLGELVAPGAGGLISPNSMRISGSNLYVTDASNNTVLRFNATTGAFVDTFVTAGSGGLNRPRDLLFYGSHLLVISEVNNRVLRYNATTGAYVDALITTGLDRPQRMLIGPDGDLYVNSQGARTLSRFDPTTGAAKGVLVTVASPASVGCPVFVDAVGAPLRIEISGVTLRNSVARDIGTGHGLFNGKGVNTLLADSVVRDNQSNSPGAGITNGGLLTVTRSTITANATLTGTSGGTQYSGGGIMNGSGAVLTVIDSTISDNIAVRGGGVRNAGGSMTIINSTISGNRAQARGGGVMNFGPANIAFSTIVDNEANITAWGSGGGSEDAFGGGVYNEGALSLANTVLARNSDNRTRFDAAFSPDCWSKPTGADLISRRGNLIGVFNARCPLQDASAPALSDQTGTDTTPLNPRLGALLDNGGPTHTHRPLSDSPLIDAANTTLSSCPAADQRGAARPAACDAGAVEFGVDVVMTVTVRLPWVGKGQ